MVGEEEEEGVGKEGKKEEEGITRIRGRGRVVGEEREKKRKENSRRKVKCIKLCAA